MLSTVARVPDGLAGVQEIVDLLNRIKTRAAQLPALRSVATRIIRGTGEGDQAAQINALARFVRQALIYTADPLNAEFIQTPDVLLLQIAQAGSVRGDCDDHCVLFGALAESISIPATIAAVKINGAPLPDHVIVIVQLEAGPLEFDLCAKGREQPYYPEKLLPTDAH